MQSEVETWVGAAAVTAARESPPPSVSLLAPEPYANRSNEALLYRSTTYSAKAVQGAPFQNAAVYVQDSLRGDSRTHHGCLVDDLSPTQLYTMGYRSYLQAQQQEQRQQQQESKDETPTLPSAPPDFDGNLPTNPEAVAQHVCSLATAYNSTPHVPTPFEIYSHIILDADAAFLRDGAATATTTAAASEPPAAAAAATSEAVQDDAYNITEEEEEAMTPVMPPTHSDPEAFAMSMALSSPQQLSEVATRALIDQVKASPQLALALPASIVDAALDYLTQAAQGREGRQGGALCALVGMLVCRRGKVSEVLRLLDIFEAFATRLAPNTGSSSSSGNAPIEEDGRQGSPRQATSSQQPLLPFARDMLAMLTFNLTALCPVLSPMDCYQGEASKLRLAVPEGSGIQCFCVSSKRQLLAAATGSSLGIFDLTTGALRTSRELNVETNGSSFWAMTFSRDAAFLVCTDAQGMSHSIYNVADLSTHAERTTNEVALPLQYGKNDELTVLPAPLLPSASTSSLYLFQGSGRLLHISELMSEATESFTICAHVHRDYRGTLVQLETDGEGLSVQLEKDVIKLVQEDATCYGVLTSAAPWLFLQARWCKGVWSLSANFALVELRGSRAGQCKSLLLTGASCLHGSGHVGSLAAWCGPNDALAVRTYYKERRIDATAAASSALRPLFSLPLDEGTGIWLKETVRQGCYTIAETRGVWDEQLRVPVLPSPTARAAKAKKGGESCQVRLDAKTMLEGRALVSAYKVYLLLPSAASSSSSASSAAPQKGADDMVVEVSRAHHTILRVYRCPRLSADNLYALLPDESEMVVYQQRFSSFVAVPLCSPRSRESELVHAGLLPARTAAANNQANDEEEEEEGEADTAGGNNNNSSMTVGSLPWVLHAMYKTIYVLSYELQRVPLENTPLSMANLSTLTRLLHTLRSPPVASSSSHGDTNRGGQMAEPVRRLKVLAMLALTQAHFQKLYAMNERRIVRIAAGLKETCQAIVAGYEDATLRKAALELCNTATLLSLTVHDRAQILLHADAHINTESMSQFVSKESMLAVVHHLALASGNNNNDNNNDRDETPLLMATRKLLQACEAEAEADTAQRTITQLFFWFASATVHTLVALHRGAELGPILRLLLDYASELVVRDARELRAQPPSHVSVLQTGVIPLLVLIAAKCPEALSHHDAEALLMQLLHQLQQAPAMAAEKIGFTTREACDVYLGTRSSSSANGNNGAGNENNNSGNGAEERLWRCALDYVQASSVTILREATAAGGQSGMTVLRASPNTVPLKAQVSAESPTAKVDGGHLVIFGAGETTFTVIAQYEFAVTTAWANTLAEAVEHALLRYAASLTARPPSTDVFVAPLLRHGLTSEVLQRHGIALAGREQPGASFASEILADVEEGKEYTDEVCQSMRGSIIPSMRPAIQALLAILLHSGASPTQAEDELRLRWFTGEWGSRLQGPTRECTRSFIVDLAAWMTRAVFRGPQSSLPANYHFARPALDRARHEPSMNLSRSMSERRGSTSSRRSFMKAALHGDTLEQVRLLLTKEVDAVQLEYTLVDRTRAALQMEHGLHILLAMLPDSTDGGKTSSAAGERTVAAILRVLWDFAAMGTNTHYVDCITGAGLDLESRVRQAFHAVLRRCDGLLLTTHVEGLTPQAVLTSPAAHGRATMLLLGLLCHPWDAQDTEMTKTDSGGDEGEDLLQRLEGAMNVPADVLTIRSSWRLRRASRPELSEPEERQVRLELLGAADLTSLSRIYPNDFSVVIPQFQTSRSEEGILIDKHRAGAAVLRADEGWPLGGRDGVPCVFYYEVRLSAAKDKLEIGLCFAKNDFGIRGVELPYFYESGGGTHTIAFPAYVEGDTVGCGVVTTSRRVFFTLNGHFIAFVGAVAEKQELLFPTLRFGEQPGTKVLVNFGSSGFAYDFRRLHPGLTLHEGPTWYRVAATAEMALHYISVRACAVHEARRPGTGLFLSHCCEVVCRNVNRMTSSLMNVGGGGGGGAAGRASHEDAGTRVKQAVILSVTEYALLVLISAMRGMVSAGPASTTNNSSGGGSLAMGTASSITSVAATPASVAPATPAQVIAANNNNNNNNSNNNNIVTTTLTSATPLPDAVSAMIFDAVSVLMLLPLHSIQISTISLLPEVIAHVRTVPDNAAADNLVQTLFDHATKEGDRNGRIPFVPIWTECDSRSISIANVQYAHMLPEAQRSIVLGTVLPRTGLVSFTVKITRRGMTKGHSLKGGYFIGVSLAGLTPLSPTSNSQSWKSVKPPTVWAIHDTSPQLPHATNPTVKPNNFQRTFGNGDTIRVVVDRDNRSIDFYRDDEFLKTLFSDLPGHAELVPFVQLYNDDAAVVIGPGEMTAPISAPTLLGAASVAVLRSMLTLEPFQRLVAREVCNELDTQRCPRVTLALFYSLPDPRLLQLRSPAGEDLFITVSRIGDLRCKFFIGEEANYEHLHHLRTPARPKITCAFESRLPVNALGGLSQCVGRLVAALRRMVQPLITTHALACIEMDERRVIVEEEKDHWDYLFHGLRVGSYITIQRVSQTRSLITALPIPRDFAFSAALSNPSFRFAAQFCGRLATVPSGVKNATTPFIAIAEPQIAMTGKVSLRCQLIRGHTSQILGGGYYFGICTKSFSWKRKELNNATSEVWALHDMDDTPWRLRHMLPTAVFPIAAEPRCIIVSGDILRLEIDRDEGTIYAFRKPINEEEMALGLIYDNVPANVALYPFVHLFNNDAVAVLLPSNSAEHAVRMTVQQPHFALTTLGERRCCDSCAAQHIDSKLASVWYKCNECADYAICKSCFDLAAHSYHAFTEMGPNFFVHASAAPQVARVGMDVVVAGTSCMYLRSGGCKLSEKDFHCVAEAIEDDAFVLWGLVHKGRGQFTVAIDTTDREPLSTEHPTFVGVAAAEHVVHLSRDELRRRCLAASSNTTTTTTTGNSSSNNTNNNTTAASGGASNGSGSTTGGNTVVTYCSDATLRHKLDNTSRQPYGFDRGCTVTLDVNTVTGMVLIARDWVTVGSAMLELPSSASSSSSPSSGAGEATPPLCCFVVFGKKNTTANILPDRTPALRARVEEVNGGIVTVSNGERRFRYVTLENCRLLLRRCTTRRANEEAEDEAGAVAGGGVDGDTLEPGRLGYTFVNRQMLQCAVVGPEPGSMLRVHFMASNMDGLIPRQHLLVDDFGALVAESFLHKERFELGPALDEGFVISRLLLILSCLCETDTLSSLVMLYSGELLSVIKRLASVQLSNDAPLDALDEIRSSVAATAHCMGGVDTRRAANSGSASASNAMMAASQHLSAFVPTLGVDEKRKKYKPGVLVRVVVEQDASEAPSRRISSSSSSSSSSAANAGEHTSRVYKVLSRHGEYLRVQDIDAPAKELTLSYKACVPIKQSAGRPWHTLDNGLPCSLLEHTIRISNAGLATRNVSIEGDWQGEMVLPKVGGVAVELKLKRIEVGHATIGLAAAGQQSEVEYYVFYVHERYERTVRMCLVSNDAWHRKFFAALHAEKVPLSYEDKLALLERTLVAGAHEGLYFIEAELDVEGLRLSGTCRPKDGKVGGFTANSMRRLALGALSTELLQVEPLPDCLDTAAPTLPQRDVVTSMRRLIILLARHLYLVICTKTNTVSREFTENIFLFHKHPLADRLVTQLVGLPALLNMVFEANQLILDPGVKPWDVATLAHLVTRSFLLRPEITSVAPLSFLWDTVHAVLVATHRAGRDYRDEMIRHLTTFVQSRLERQEAELPIYAQLFAALFTYVDRHIALSTHFAETRKDIAAGVYLVLLMRPALQRHIRNIPIPPLHCLIDLWHAIADGTALPQAVESSLTSTAARVASTPSVAPPAAANNTTTITSIDNRNSATAGGSTTLPGVSAAEEEPVEAFCTFGDFVHGELKVGKIMSSRPAGKTGRYYYEVTMPEQQNAPFAVGWGTLLHTDVPSQHVGSDRFSFCYNGTDVMTKESKEEYKVAAEVSPGCVIGCLLDMDEKAVAWSVNGVLGPFTPIPIVLGDGRLYAFASIGSCSGMAIRLAADKFEYVPDGYTDLSGRYTRVLIDHYDMNARSGAIPVQSPAFYAQLAAFLSDVEEHKEDRPLASTAGSSTTPSSLVPPSPGEVREMYIGKYPLINSVPRASVEQQSRVIAVIESCMASASRFVDLDGDTVTGALSIAFVNLKPFVRRSFRRKLLVHIPPVEKVSAPPTISIRITELHSTLPRSPDVALQHTVLSQLYKQIGAYADTQWSQVPLFKVHLYISGSGHAPIDLGGPYRQVWTFLSEEMMSHPDKCYPHSDYHRNPLFAFINNSQRVSLVPDGLANSPYELTLFNFFGKILGHTARAKSPLDIDFSPFMWKYLVDDVLTIRDYYQHVDSVVEKSMQDDNFLLSGIAEEIIPGFADSAMWADEEDIDEDKIAQHRRSIAENCLVHSMDEQLNALRSGLWSVLPRRVVRCLSWRDLERLVCGESDPTVDELKKYIRAQLQPTREKQFWQIVEEMNGEQKSSLLCFASGQRRLPLIRPITITENNESVEHLPRAQSCSSLITIPPYTSLEMFREKFLMALQHQMEMELA